MEVTRAQAWVLASRPKTLTAAVSPVLVGMGLAASHNQFRWAPALAAPVGAIIALRSNTYQAPQMISKNLQLVTWAGRSTLN